MIFVVAPYDKRINFSLLKTEMRAALGDQISGELIHRPHTIMGEQFGWGFRIDGTDDQTTADAVMAAHNPPAGEDDIEKEEEARLSDFDKKVVKSIQRLLEKPAFVNALKVALGI